MADQSKTRMTNQRSLILEELRSLKSHPTADELFIAVRRRLPRISLGTVYRNLQILSKQGTIRTLPDTKGQMRFDGDNARHYHVRCIKCRRVDDLPGRPVVHFEREREGKTNYRILGFKIELLGICPECNEREKPERQGQVRQ